MNIRCCILVHRRQTVFISELSTMISMLLHATQLKHRRKSCTISMTYPMVSRANLVRHWRVRANTLRSTIETMMTIVHIQTIRHAIIHRKQRINLWKFCHFHQHDRQTRLTKRYNHMTDIPSFHRTSPLLLLSISILFFCIARIHTQTLLSIFLEISNTHITFG